MAPSAESDGAAKRSSKRIEKLLSVTSLQGGCTPRRRACRDIEPEYSDSSHINLAGLVDKAVVMPDLRTGVVLSSGHGFFAVQIDESCGGGEAKLRGNQLQIRTDIARDDHRMFRNMFQHTSILIFFTSWLSAVNANRKRAY